MTSSKDLYNHLDSLLKLLQEEKEALIHNDVVKVSKIVEKKNEYIEKLAVSSTILEEAKDVIPSTVEVSPLLQLINEIKIIQETNLLLTKQSLSYQNGLLESISKSIQNTSNTYSAKGNYQRINNIGLIDQEV